MKKLIALMSLMFLGCCKESVTDQFQQVGFDPELLYEAADDWCEASGGRHCATFEGGQNLIKLMSSSEFEEMFYYSPMRLGVILRDNSGPESRIFVKNRIAERSNIRKTIMHELGHHFGCNHVSKEGDIMSVYESEVEHLTAKDIECVD